MRNAVVIFTKVPCAGTTKTRLTIERGGILSEEEAKEFYQACLLDLLESCLKADCCDLYICYDAAGDGAYLEQIVGTVAPVGRVREIFCDTGETFDKGMQYAVDHILKQGSPERLADAVVILGGDMPTLQPQTLRDAFQRLDQLSLQGSALVISADQECGFNIIGYTHGTPFRFDEVFYNRLGVTALDMVAIRAVEQEIPVALLETVPDIDLVSDFAHLLTLLKTMQLAHKQDSSMQLPLRTINVLAELGYEAAAYPATG
jgi:uncharacterized protein